MTQGTWEDRMRTELLVLNSLHYARLTLNSWDNEMFIVKLKNYLIDANKHFLNTLLYNID